MSSSSSSSASAKSHHLHHRTAGQSPTISVEEYLSRCFQAIDDLADNPYLNGTLQSPSDDGPVHMGRGSSSASGKHAHAQSTKSVSKSVRNPETGGHGVGEEQERVPLVDSSDSSSSSASSKAESTGGAKGGLKRAFKRPSLFR